MSVYFENKWKNKMKWTLECSFNRHFNRQYNCCCSILITRNEMTKLIGRTPGLLILKKLPIWFITPFMLRYHYSAFMYVCSMECTLNQYFNDRFVPCNQNTTEVKSIIRGVCLVRGFQWAEKDHHDRFKKSLYFFFMLSLFLFSLQIIYEDAKWANHFWRNNHR